MLKMEFVLMKKQKLIDDSDSFLFSSFVRESDQRGRFAHIRAA